MLEQNPRYPQYPRKPGYIYILFCKGLGYKIGKTKNMHVRIQNYRQFPYNLTLIHTIKTGDMDWAEWALHRKYAKYRTQDEWFDLQPDHLDWLLSLAEITPSTQ